MTGNYYKKFLVAFLKGLTLHRKRLEGEIPLGLRPSQNGDDTPVTSCFLFLNPINKELVGFWYPYPVFF